MRARTLGFGLAGLLLVLGLIIWSLRGPQAPAPDAGPVPAASLPGDAADAVLPLVLDALATCGQQVQPACTGAGQLSFQIAVERERGRVGQFGVDPAVLVPAVETCTREALRRLDFGRGLGTGSLEVIYPLACRDGQLRLARLADQTRTRPLDVPPKPAPAQPEHEPQAQ